jgi:uncharacterized protein YcbX
MSTQAIGHLEILRRYPVKSMSGEDLDEVYVAYTGVTGDRVFAFVDNKKAGEGDNFPWHSAREQANMLLFRPRFLGAPAVSVQYPKEDAFRVEVTTPSGKTLRVDDPALLAELSAKGGEGVTLRFSEKGMQDSRPLSLFALDTLQSLAEEAGVPIDHRQFRANFYVRWTNGKPYYEDELVGRRVKIGDTLEAMVVKKDPRCVIINLDPETAQSRIEVLKTVARKHAGCVGVYLATLREGVVKKGDPIMLMD